MKIMLRAIRYTCITLALLFIAVPLVTSPLLARDPVQGGLNYDTDVFTPAIESQDVNLQSTVYEVVLSIISTLNRTTFCVQAVDMASGTEVGPCTSVPLTEVESPGMTTTYVPRGILPQLAQVNSAMIGRPAVSGAEYISDISDKLNLGIQPAYAQGIGYAGLGSLIDIWQAFRNIAYLFATAGFLVLAFMVMLRIKAGQGVINAQASITKFIFVVLAITFSYAIAGFVVDLIYVFSGLVIAAFISTGLLSGPISAVESEFYSGSIIQTTGKLLSYATPAGDSIGRLASTLFGTALSSGGSGAPGAIGWLFEWGVSGIAWLIISIAMIYALFKLFVQLLMAYIQIILYTILSPLIILPDILPGGSAFSSWLRNLFAHAMIFPATVFTLILGTIIVQKTGLSETTPGNVGNISGLTLPFLNIDPSVISPLIGIGFILVIPKVNNMVKDFFKVSSFKYTSEIGTAVGVGAAVAGRTAGAISKPAKWYAGTEAGIWVENKARGAERTADQSRSTGDQRRSRAWRSAQNFGANRGWWSNPSNKK